MGGEARLLILAVQFLTRLPTPGTGPPAPDWLARAAKAFPLVGAGVGGLCALALLAGRAVWGGSALPALAAVAAGVALTGALHEDGLADVADGMGGPTRESRFAIMKDSRLGTYGALALLLTLSAKVAAIAAVPIATAAAGLVCAHAGGRAAAVWAMSRLPYAATVEASGLAAADRSMRPGELTLATAFAAAPLLLLVHTPAAMLACPLAAALAAFGTALACRARLGGHTGDVLGAVEQTYEVAFLLTLAAVHHLDGLQR